MIDEIRKINCEIININQKNNEILLNINLNYKTNMTIIPILQYLNSIREEYKIKNLSINDSSMEEVLIYFIGFYKYI